MLSPKLVLLFLLSELSFGFFLSISFLFERFVLMFKPSLSFFSKTTQAVTYSILMYYKIMLAYKTKKKDLSIELIFLKALFIQILTNLI
jgi:hypothetical protein